MMLISTHNPNWKSMRAAAVLVAGVALVAWMTGCRVHVDKGSNGQAAVVHCHPVV